MTISFRQYFGPNRRHPEACVEITFPATDEPVSLGDAQDALRKAGSGLTLADASRKRDLADAVGTLACAVFKGQGRPRWTSGSADGVGWVCMSNFSPMTVAIALRNAHALIVHGAAPDILRELLAVPAKLRPFGEISFMLMRAAADVGISAMILSEAASTYQLGVGAQGRHFFELASDGDSLTGLNLSQEKLATVELLQRLHLPTTKSVFLYRAEDAPALARRIGYPCVVKPRNRGKGNGVTARILSERHLADAVARALEASNYPLLMENHVEGMDHRMIVVGGKMLWAYRRTPPYVVGDGTATIESLIDRENQRRKTADAAHRSYLKDIVCDTSLLNFIDESHGFTRDSVLAAGQRLDLRGEANLALGGTLKDVTEQVHEDNRQMAVRIARLFRMEALGIDFMTPDISRSWKDIPCAVIEVNSTPGLSGPGDASLAVKTMMPFRLSGKVPTFVVIGKDAYRQTASRAIAAALARAKLVTGHCEYKLAADGFRSLQSPMIESLVLDPRADAIIVSCSAADIDAKGFPVRWCDVVFTDQEGVPDHVARSASRVVAGVADGSAIGAIVDGVVSPYLASDKGGPHPTLEIIRTPGESGALVRCWRTRAISRASFVARMRQIDGTDPVALAGMIGPGDILGGLETLVGIRLRTAGGTPGDIALGSAPRAHAWETPYIDIRVSVAPAAVDACLEALAFSVNTINALIDELD